MLRLRAVDRVVIPPGKAGNVIRGAFGAVFRSICCTPACGNSPAGRHRPDCPYGLIFEPGPPAGAEVLRKLESIPRPFVFRPPLHHQQELYLPGQELSFGLLLFGRAIPYLRYFLASFHRLAEEGLGVGKGRVYLDGADEISPGGACRPIYESHTGIVGDLRWSFDAVAAAARNAQSAERVNMLFLTPTHLVVGGKAVRSPQFADVFKRARDRVNALSTFYGGGRLEADFAALGRLSEQVERKHADIRWISVTRRSMRTGHSHPLSGFVGAAEYQGDLTPFLPWLLAGQYCHVGKHAVWGNGRYTASLA